MIDDKRGFYKCFYLNINQPNILVFLIFLELFCWNLPFLAARFDF